MTLDGLIELAVAWAARRDRLLDEELLTNVLELRENQDDYPPTYWPARSAERLLLVTLPAYGREVPDTERLAASLDTFWAFLRATGRMQSTSAAPAELRKEARRALPRMAAAYANPANHSQSRVLANFGKSIGIDLDEPADSMADLQARLDAIVQSWNGLPEAERQRLMPDPRAKSLRAAEFTMLANDRLSDASEETVAPGEVEASGRGARTSGFARACLALADWVGDGKPTTKAGLLRPAVAREVYQELDLWTWDRAFDQITFRRYRPDDTPAHDALRAEAALRSWRSAGDCLALDRLWWASVAAGLIDVGSAKASRSSLNPATAQEWRDLGLVLLAALCERLGPRDCEPLVGVFGSAVLAEGQVSLAEIRRWWQSRCPPALADVMADYWSDQLDLTLFHFDDCGLWLRSEHSLRLTDFGRDFAIVYFGLLDRGFGEE